MIAVRMSTSEMSDKLLKILDNASLPAGAEAAWFIRRKRRLPDGWFRICPGVVP